MTNNQEPIYDKLLQSYETLLEEEAKAIQAQELDRLSSLEKEKNSVLDDMIACGKSLKPSPKKHPLFRDRMRFVLEKQEANLQLINEAVQINRTATKNVENKRNRAQTVHKTYRHSNRSSEPPADGFRA